MEWLFIALPGVLCAGMMLLVCGPMMFGKKKHACGDENVSKQELAELREEVARLRASSDAAATSDARVLSPTDTLEEARA